MQWGCSAEADTWRAVCSPKAVDSRAVHFAKPDCLLTSAGAVVRNTFIDIPEPPEACGRSSSVPPGMRLAMESEPGSPMLRRRRARHMTMPEQSIRGLLADLCTDSPPRQPSVSSGCTESTTCSEWDGAGGEAEEEAWRAAGDKLARLVLKECAFMRFRGFWLHAEKSGRARRRGVAGILRFYVHGLPWAKRAKWLQPLLWTVMAVLEKHRLAATMQGGQLYAPLEGLGALVRVDFAAARE